MRVGYDKYLQRTEINLDMMMRIIFLENLNESLKNLCCLKSFKGVSDP